LTGDSLLSSTLEVVWQPVAAELWTINYAMADLTNDGRRKIVVRTTGPGGDFGDYQDLMIFDSLPEELNSDRPLTIAAISAFGTKYSDHSIHINGKTTPDFPGAGSYDEPLLYNVIEFENHTEILAVPSNRARDAVSQGESVNVFVLDYMATQISIACRFEVNETGAGNAK
jgi:hypothetical protein